MTSFDEFEEQIEEYKKKLKRYMGDAEALMGLGNIWMFQGRMHEARRMFELAIEKSPGSPKAEFLLGSWHLNREDAEAAEKCFRAAGDYAPALQMLAVLLIDRDRGKEALPLIEKAVALDADNAELRYELGNLYDDAGEPGQALAQYEVCLNIDPDYAKAWNAIGLVRADEDDWDGAIEAYRKALAIDPEYSNAHLNLAVAFVNHDNVPVADAEDEYKHAIRFDAGNVDAMLGLGEIYYEDGDYAKSLHSFNMAADAAPNSAQAFLCIANAQYAMGRREEAEDAYRRAAMLDEESGEPHFWIATILREREQHLEAVVHFTLYLEKSPEGENAEKASQELNSLRIDWPI